MPKSKKSKARNLPRSRTVETAPPTYKAPTTSRPRSRTATTTRKRRTTSPPPPNYEDVDTTVITTETTRPRSTSRTDTITTTPSGRSRSDTASPPSPTTKPTTKKKKVKSSGETPPLPPPFPPFPPRIEELMNEHMKQAPAEKEAFSGVRFVDQVWKLSKTKKKQLVKMSAAMEAAKDRQKEIRKELTKWKAKTACEKKRHLEARTFETTMMIHFPAQFQADPGIKLQTRVKRLQKAAKMSDSKKAVAIQLLQDPGLEVLKHEQSVFRKAIESGLGKKKMKKFLRKKKSFDYDEIDPFFDKALKALTPKQVKELYKVNQDVVERGYKIRDYDGSADDVEKALQHLPIGFWPPTLVDDLQAWRHVERELVYEKITELKEEAQKFWSADNMNTLVNTIGDVGEVLGGSSKAVAKGFSKKEGIAVSTTIESSKLFLLSLVKLEVKVKTPEDLVKSLKKMKKKDLAELVTEMTKFTSSLAGVVSLGDLTPAGKAFVELCPVLGAIGAGMDLSIVAIEAAKIAKKRDVAKKELKTLKKLNENLKIRPDKAMEYALGNDVSGRDLQLANKIIGTIGTGVTFAGSVTSATGGAGLGVTGKCIGMGNTLAFSCIDSKTASKAMKTLQQARAGSTKAQKKIFKDSAVYAKMYMAMKAKDGDKFAIQLIENRGLTQEDLDRPEMSLRIIRQALMDDAGQKDESKRANFAMNIATDFLGEGTVNLITGTMDGDTKGSKK